MEVSQSASKLLLNGSEIEGLPDWNFGRNQPVRFIDFETPANNGFLVINQFKVELTKIRAPLRLAPTPPSPSPRKKKSRE